MAEKMLEEALIKATQRFPNKGEDERLAIAMLMEQFALMQRMQWSPSKQLKERLTPEMYEAVVKALLTPEMAEGVLNLNRKDT